MMQILGLLDMYFDAAVVCICHQPDTFIQVGSGHTVEACHFEVSENSLPFVFSCTSYQKIQIANSWREWHFVFLLPTPCLFSFFIIIWILDNI